jgi:hypothetical protein
VVAVAALLQVRVLVLQEQPTQEVVAEAVLAVLELQELVLAHKAAQVLS